jgi:hypothetical protein
MNNSPYLDRPLLPIAVALPRMLQEIEAVLGTAGPAETRRLRQRAGRPLSCTPPARGGALQVRWRHRPEQLTGMPREGLVGARPHSGPHFWDDQLTAGVNHTPVSISIQTKAERETPVTTYTSSKFHDLAEQRSRHRG